MPIVAIINKPNKPSNSILQNAYTILSNSYKAANSFFNQFKASRKGRRGAPTDKEQDLLRAMLVFASSGLDSMVKQLIRDALPIIIEKDDGAMLLFSERVEKTISKDQNINVRLLTKAILSDTPRTVLIDNFVEELTTNSLQSAEELLRVGSYFNIASNNLTSDIKQLKKIFKVRNQISHEMDIDFSQSNRSRCPRRRNEMVSYTNELFKLGELFLKLIDKKLSS